MRINNKLTLQLIAYHLILSIFLQGCSNTPITSPEKPTRNFISSNTTSTVSLSNPIIDSQVLQPAQEIADITALDTSLENIAIHSTSVNKLLDQSTSKKHRKRHHRKRRQPKQEKDLYKEKLKREQEVKGRKLGPYKVEVNTQDINQSETTLPAVKIKEPKGKEKIVIEENVPVINDPKAQFKLGKQAYANWKSEKSNLAYQKEAISWLSQAAIKGYEPAADLYEILQMEALKYAEEQQKETSEAINIDSSNSNVILETRSVVSTPLPKSEQSGYVYVGIKGSGSAKDDGMPSLPGYKVLDCLHEGTSSNIYRAIRLSDEYPVIIKVSTQKVLIEKKAQRFCREFELGQQVYSPYVVRYLELKQDPTYGMALIMEDDQSVELTSIIPPSGFSNCEFLEIGIQIVQGLQAIHDANIIHSDLKLSNILIHPTTKAIKIIDFNRASTLRQERQSAIPMMVGTLAYISPEQTGRVNRSIDYRTDFYSLGVIFYRLLCGRLPFTAQDALGLIHQHLAKHPLTPHQCKPTIALPLSQMVMKLLEKEVEDRYQSCEGILYDLKVCLSALYKTDSIPEFELGQQDFSSKLTLSQRLYGRENEIKTLEKAFERVSKGKCEGLMVAGHPGVGKTMLIQEIQKPIALKRGYFLTGKFDQLNKNVAYSALTQAFNGLIQQWLNEDEVSIAQWKTRLLATLGTQASLLIKVVPVLTLLIGEQPETAIADMNQAKNVFNWIFQEFVKICADEAHPLVIFLDDLQWADQASLDLMIYLMTQSRVNYLLWIGAYRDTEVTASHPALQAVATLQETGVCVQTLLLAPLQLESLCQWIADSLRKSLMDIQPLGELIFQKTGGNPFFVKLFLQALYEEQLLTFAPQTHWQWNLAKIRRHPVTENVINLMIYQIQQLPTETQHALSIASCLGHRMALSTLQTAMASLPEAVGEALQPALNSGILMQLDSELYFAHDRVQEAAYRLIREEEKAQIHLTIGQRLLAEPISEEVLLFDIIAQFNRCRLLITESQERLQMALLYLKAGQKAKQATAYASALDYLYASQDWIDRETIWKTDYTLAFTLYKELAEVEYLSGHMGISQALIANIQPRLQSNLDKIDIYHLLIIQKTLQGNLQEALTIGHQALQLLNSGLPLDNPTEFIQQEMPLLRKKLAGILLSSLLDMPLVVEPEKQAIFKILESIYAASYFTGSEVYSAIALTSINLLLTHGHTPESCHIYAAYGLLLCSKFEEYALGYEFGNLALQLAERLRLPAQQCKSSMVMLGFISPWSKSIQQLPTLLTSAYESCLACGELEFAGYCGFNKAVILLSQGIPLTKVQQEVLPLLQFTYNTKNQNSANTIQAVQRVLANLREDTSDECNFDTDAIHEAQFEEGCQQTNSFFALCVYHIFKAQVFYLYDHFKQALDNLALAKKHLIVIAGHYITAIFNWYDSLIRLALYPTASHEDQLAYLEQVAQNQQQMQKWQASCPENFVHKYLLVKAELARVKSHDKLAESYYDQAIELADRHGFIQEQALAAELATKYWLTKGKSLCAQSYINTALNGYKQWGAKRKLTLLKDQYADLLNALAPPGLSQLAINQEITLSSNTLKLLDLSSIIKASHAISSEIELPRLLHKMMQIIIENAGAQQGALLFVEADDIMWVQAEYNSDGTITTLQHIPLDDWNNGAQTIIQYVKKLHQSVALDHAATNEQFKMDPYIRRTRAKSILCVPLLKHAELRAILYVENNLMSHVFTPERVQTVLILTAQMAISLENARYFAEQLALTRQLAEQSARRQIAEESLRAVTHNLKLALEASQAGTWTWWIGTDQVTWDAVHYALFGLTPDQFKGTYEAVVECVHPEDRERFKQDVKRCIEQDIPHDIEYRIIWPDSSQHVIAAHGRAYHDLESGKPIKMTGVCLDVTQRKRLEQERLEALKRVEEEFIRRQEALHYQQRQKEYTETVCHELRNPLQGLIGSTELLKTDMSALSANLTDYQQTQTPESKMQVDACMEHCQNCVANQEECIDHLKDLLDDVLNLAKLEANKMELAIGIIQPKAIIQSVAKMFAAKLVQKGLQLNLELPKEDILVKGDAQRLKQIIINLVANALKFTEQGSITLGLKVLEVTPTYTRLQFMVADTGIGMTSEERSRLFQRFSQANVNVASQYGGTGLGLAISDNLVKLMGGQIEVASEKGKGTQFTFILECATPIQEELEELEALGELEGLLEELNALASQPEASLVPATLPIVELQVKKILVVDDSSINRQILAKLLKDLGYTSIQTAADGKEAVQRFSETGPFNLIFMDIEMPMMNGYEVSQQIREQEQELKLASTPIIGLTGHKEEQYIQRALAAGMNEVLGKPYRKADIQHVVATWLESP